MSIPQLTNRQIALHYCAGVALVCGLLGAVIGYYGATASRLAAHEQVLIDEAELVFEARLDTGATVSSINALDIEVIGGDGKPRVSDVGKRVRFVLQNRAGEKALVEAKIEQVRSIKTSDCVELRYHVYLNLTHRGESYRLLMNLNDRSRSNDKLLLGRNWLDHGFTVDVSKT